METITLVLLCVAAFVAGFVDAVAGGGGLIQVPAGLVLLPNLPVSTVIGTLKIPALSGTSLAAWQYMKKVRMNLVLLFTMAGIAFLSAFAGSALLTQVSNAFMKPLLLVILILIAVYTFSKKDFGNTPVRVVSPKRQLLAGITASIIIGFYDGFIGPGAGSFFMLAFISLLGFDFLHASANAKMVNIATNLGSVVLFLVKGKIIWAIALPMALCNAAGGWLGAKTAIRKGNSFIRIFFLIIVTLTLLKFAYDILMVNLNNGL